MITNAQVLQDEFIPKEVKHRDQEAQLLANNLEGLPDQKKAENTMIYGPSGAGKTCISKYITQELKEQILDINHQYINCWQDYNRYKVLYRLLEGLNKTVDIHRQSTPQDKMIERLKNYEGPPYVVILDEADQLEDKKVLYDLYSLNNVTLIMISNSIQEFLASMGERLRSRFSTLPKIEFKKYTEREIISILQDRVKWGLKPGVIHREQLQLIARHVDGDARLAIGSLRQSTKKAMQQNLDEITNQVIREAIPKAEEETKQKKKDNLNKHQEALYNIIEEEGPINPGNLYKEYREKIENPRTNRTLRRYLKKMEHYKLVESRGKNKAREYQIK